jgi:hypothetical protein
MANYWQKRTYAELSTEPGSLAERGLVYLVSRFFTVGSNASVSFLLRTQTPQVHFKFYDIASDSSTIKASLIEGASVTISSASIQGYNLNRQYLDAHSTLLYSCSAVSGGYSISSELVGSGAKSGGVISQDKVHTLRNDTDYVMTFYNVGNQSTNAHLNLGWTENDPNHYKIVEGVTG